MGDLEDFCDVIACHGSFTVTDFLGSGAYGTVCAVKDEDSQEVVAIKKCQKIFNSKTLTKRALREIRLLRHISHPNIVSLKKVLFPPTVDFNEIYLVFELMDTDLAQIIKSSQTLRLEHIQYFSYQLLSALEFLHSANIIHRDLKPRNILINADCSLKLADFGLARVFEDAKDFTCTAITDYVTTRWYRAPEILAGWTHYGSAIDMWAVGCIIAELFRRIPLFPGKDSSKQLEAIFSILGKPNEPFITKCRKASRRLFIRSFIPMPNQVPIYHMFLNASDDAIDLVSRLLMFDPSQRLSAKECLNHEFVIAYSSPITKHYEVDLREYFEYEEKLQTMNDWKQEMYKEVQYYKYHSSSSEQSTCEEDVLCAEFEKLPAGESPMKGLDCNIVTTACSTLIHQSSVDTEAVQPTITYEQNRVPVHDKSLLPEEETSPFCDSLVSNKTMHAPPQQQQQEPFYASPTTKTRPHRNQSQETIVFDYRPPSGDECSLISFTEYEGKIGSNQSISSDNNNAKTITKHSFGCQVTEKDIRRAVQKCHDPEKVTENDHKPKKLFTSSRFDFGFCGILSSSSDNSSGDDEEKMKMEGVDPLPSMTQQSSYTKKLSTARNTSRRHLPASTCSIS